MGDAKDETKKTGTKTVGEVQSALVMKREVYNFEQYSENRGPVRDITSIDDLWEEGFDNSPYDAQWIRFNQLENAHKRYFTMVTRELHGECGWFRKEAFDPLTGRIITGQEFMKDGSGELILHIRPKEATQAEQQQMIAFGSRRRNPQEEAKANLEEVNNMLSQSGGFVKDTRKTVSWPGQTRQPQ